MHTQKNNVIYWLVVKNEARGSQEPHPVPPLGSGFSTLSLGVDSDFIKHKTAMHKKNQLYFHKGVTCCLQCHSLTLSNLLEFPSPLEDREGARGRDRGRKWGGQYPEPDGQALMSNHKSEEDGSSLIRGRELGGWYSGYERCWKESRLGAGDQGYSCSSSHP